MATSTEQVPPMYSNVLSAPKKEHAIIIDHVPESDIEDYLKELAKIVEPIRIRYISRISRNRVCCYLESKQTADQLVNQGKSITIKEQIVHIRPLTSQNKRIIISNVRPEIPNTVIIEELQNLGITPKSTITNLKAFSVDPLFSHISSFRRQVYIASEDADKIPGVRQLTFEGGTYYVYFSSDKIVCYKCKKEGHIAKNCRDHLEDETAATGSLTQRSEVLTQLRNEPYLPEVATPSPPSESTNKTDQRTPFPMFPPNKNAKRVHSSTNSTNSQITELDNSSLTGVDAGIEIPKSLSKENDSAIKKDKSSQKKMRTEDLPTPTSTPTSPPTSTLKWDETIKYLEQSPKQYPLKFEQIREFFELSIGRPNDEVMKMLDDYSQNHTGLIDLLNDIRPTLPTSGLKN